MCCGAWRPRTRKRNSKVCLPAACATLFFLDFFLIFIGRNSKNILFYIDRTTFGISNKIYSKQLLLRASRTVAAQLIEETVLVAGLFFIMD